MDEQNNPIANTNMPGAGVSPAMPEVPMGGVASAAPAGGMGVASDVTAPADATGVAAVGGPAAFTVPEGLVEPEPSAASMNPATMATPGVGMNTAVPGATGVDTAGMNTAPVNSFNLPNMNEINGLGGAGLVGATDPITMPTPPPAPDPVEEELKAPLRAAAPVPGSIGSAVSVPAEGVAPTQATSVAFNDPATANADPTKMAAAGLPAKKKKNSKTTTYVLLGVIAVIIIVMLVIILISQL